VSGAARIESEVPGAGICNACRHQHVVRTTRGSVFSLCERSRDEPERFPRYPRIPVTACPGFQRVGGDPQGLRPGVEE
jgi:hypothetical protein